MKLGLMAMFKNEGHILYEFINHYMLEGVDQFILIDDNSTDNYYENNNKNSNKISSSSSMALRLKEN